MTDPETQREAIGSDSDGAMRDHEPSSYGKVQVMSDETVYEPGPSFVETERPADRLTEMPAWLQTFAASERDPNDVSDDGEEIVPAAADQLVPQTPVVEPDNTLPEWLRTGPARVAPDATAEVLADFEDFQQPGGEGADSFISEDDLPDWLRAFSHDTAGTSMSNVPTSTRVAVTAAVAAGTTAVRVPPVENVWLSAYDRQALGPGRTLFALLASSGGIAPDAGANGIHADHGRVADSQSETLNVHAPAATVDSAPRPGRMASRDAVDKQGSPMRLVLLALLVVLVLFLMVMFLL